MAAVRASYLVRQDEGPALATGGEDGGVYGGRRLEQFGGIRGTKACVLLALTVAFVAIAPGQLDASLGRGYCHRCLRRADRAPGAPS